MNRLPCYRVKIINLLIYLNEFSPIKWLCMKQQHQHMEFKWQTYTHTHSHSFTQFFIAKTFSHPCVCVCFFSECIFFLPQILCFFHLLYCPRQIPCVLMLFTSCESQHNICCYTTHTKIARTRSFSHHMFCCHFYEKMITMKMLARHIALENHNAMRKRKNWEEGREWVAWVRW